jgi:hypothetical protein
MWQGYYIEEEKKIEFKFKRTFHVQYKAVSLLATHMMEESWRGRLKATENWFSRSRPLMVKYSTFKGRSEKQI